MQKPLKNCLPRSKPSGVRSHSISTGQNILKTGKSIWRREREQSEHKSSGHQIQDVEISYNYVGILLAALLYDLQNDETA